MELSFICFSLSHRTPPVCAVLRLRDAAQANGLTEPRLTVTFPISSPDCKPRRRARQHDAG